MEVLILIGWYIGGDPETLGVYSTEESANFALEIFQKEHPTCFDRFHTYSVKIDDPASRD